MSREFNEDDFKAGFITSDKISGGSIIASKNAYSVTFAFPDKNGNAVLKIAPDGKIFVRGKEIANDIDVYNGLIDLLTGHGLYKQR